MTLYESQVARRKEQPWSRERGAPEAREAAGLLRYPSAADGLKSDLYIIPEEYLSWAERSSKCEGRRATPSTLAFESEQPLPSADCPATRLTHGSFTPTTKEER